MASNPSTRLSSPARRPSRPNLDSPPPSSADSVTVDPAPPSQTSSPHPFPELLASLAPAFDTIPLADTAPSSPTAAPRPNPAGLAYPAFAPSSTLAPPQAGLSSPPSSSSRTPPLSSATEPAIQAGLAPGETKPQTRSVTNSVDTQRRSASSGNGKGRKSYGESTRKNEGSAGIGRPGEGGGNGRLVLEKLTLYETSTKFYVIASNQADSRYRVLKIDRTAAPPSATLPVGSDQEEEEEGANGLIVTEDATIYSKDEIQLLLETLSAGNAGGIKRVEALFYGIAGFVRFTSTYYMILIRSRAPVALVGGHYIYHCEETSLKPITPPSGTKNAEEARQMAAFQGVDLSKNFYFSYTYDLTHTLQYNLTRAVGQPSTPASAFASLNDKWVWNRHLLRPAFRGLKGKSPWVLPLIHGFVDQAKLSVFGRTVYITLIARRSRHFAGARFLKRGVNDQGYVANDVETEQIVSEALTTPFHSPARASHRHQPSGEQHQNRRPNPRFTSFVQVRGSIPLYWSQESTNMSPKPPIELTIVDPYFSAAALHFDDLLGRYGGPITVLNLIKQKERAPRESKLLPEFEQCIDYLNQFLPQDQEIIYIPWDIAAANKQRDKDVIGILEDIAEESLEKTNFFHSGAEPTWYAINPGPDAPPYRSGPLLQSGVVRTNCIDCLDRTNAAQFVIAKAALGHQLHALGIIHDPRLPFDSDAVNLITEMYHDHGDTVALQYGGSHLVNTMETYRKIGQWTSHSRDMIENLRRYYANSFVDADKQAAIDLFLGIESLTTPLPSIAQPSPRVRRSYRDWFTPSHLTSTLSPAEAERRLRQTVEDDDDGSGNYWQSYYRPKLFTEMARHFGYKVNSTLKYKPAGHGADGIDHSPFVPRLAVPNPAARLNVGGVRRWMSHRGHSKTALRTRIQSQRIDEASPVAALPPSTTEALVARLLNPSVELDEAREYGSWVGQFEELSLSQDLSEKDALLYRNSARMASASASLSVDRASLVLYGEAVSLALGGDGTYPRDDGEGETRSINIRFD